MSKCDYCKDDEVVRQSKRDVFSPVKWICENCNFFLNYLAKLRQFNGGNFLSFGGERVKEI